jgi:hypothetical protein
MTTSGDGRHRTTPADRDRARHRVQSVTLWSGVGALAVTAVVAVGLAPGLSAAATTPTVSDQGQTQGQDQSPGRSFGQQGRGPVASSGAS